MSFVKPARSKGGRTTRQRAITRNVWDAPLANGEENIRRALREAPDSIREEGTDWYDNAFDIAAKMSDTYGFSIEQTAGTIAALSPQTGWSENLRIAHQACAMAQKGEFKRISGHTTNACDKAARILIGDDPRDVLGGRKVRSFYLNILHPRKNGPVTIDRHMIDLIVGRRGVVNTRILEKIGVYTHAASLIRSVARSEGIPALQVQAIAWCQQRHVHEVWNRLHDPKKSTMPVFVTTESPVFEGDIQKELAEAPF